MRRHTYRTTVFQYKNFLVLDPVFGFTQTAYSVPENAGPAQGAVTIDNDVILTFPCTARVIDMIGGTATGMWCDFFGYTVTHFK